MNKNVFRKPAEGRMEAVEVVAVAFTFSALSWIKQEIIMSLMLTVEIMIKQLTTYQASVLLKPFKLCV